MTTERGSDQRMGDAGVDVAWRAASAEEPTPLADTAILAAARAEARSQSRSSAAARPARWWTRWQPLAAAAGVAGLAFLLVQRLPTDSGSREMFQAPAPAAPSASAQPEVGTPAVAPSAQEPPARPEPAGSQRALPRPAAQPLPVGVEDRAEAAAASEIGDSRMPLAPQEATGIAAAESVVTTTEPVIWVQRIVALHDSGDLAAAAEELRAFRRRYSDADTRLPAELSAWAASVAPDSDR